MTERRPDMRFDYHAPSFFEVALCMLRRGMDAKECSRARVTDRLGGEQYLLTDDEELMMEVVAENICAIVRHPIDRLDWNKDKGFIARDHVLEAIAERRHGDSRKWSTLTAWSREEWLAWLRSL